jgi:hypothetical protein
MPKPRLVLLKQNNMSNNQPLTENESIEKFNFTKEKTTKKEACTKENFNKFTALQATNCAYANVPMQTTLRLIKSIFKDPLIEKEIVDIVDRCYARVSQNLKKVIAELPREYTEIPQDPIVKELIDSTGTKYSIREIEHSFRRIYFDKLPSLGYNDSFLKKMIVFYDGLQAEGPYDDISDQSIKRNLSQCELAEITLILERLKILEIKNERYTKRIKRANY